jgi:aspartate/methionine/tyrosine aminotransferase
MRTAARLDHIEPFYVMECAKAATRARAFSPRATPPRPMIFLNIGEPDFTAPPLVREAAERALRDGRTQYTDATGLPALRERISGWYAQRFGLDIAPSRIVVTAGASAALQLACLALVDTGDEVLMPDPSYPCNRHFVAAADGVPVLLPRARTALPARRGRRRRRPGRRARAACCWPRPPTPPAPRSTRRRWAASWRGRARTRRRSRSSTRSTSA